MSLSASRELTPADLRVLEPDLFGAVALMLHGRERPERRAAPNPPAEASGRIRGPRRNQLFSPPGPAGRAG